MSNKLFLGQMTRYGKFYGGELESTRVSDNMPACLSGVGFPSGAASVSGASGVKPESRNRHKDVSITDVDGNPLPAPFLPVGEKPFRGSLALHESGFAKDVGHRSGAIVARVVEAGMTATPFIGFVLEAVSCGDRQLDLPGRTFGSVSHAVTQHGGFTTLGVNDDSRCFLLFTAGNQDQGSKEAGNERFHPVDIV